MWSDVFVEYIQIQNFERFFLETMFSKLVHTFSQDCVDRFWCAIHQTTQNYRRYRSTELFFFNFLLFFIYTRLQKKRWKIDFSFLSGYYFYTKNVFQNPLRRTIKAFMLINFCSWTFLSDVPFSRKGVNRQRTFFFMTFFERRLRVNGPSVSFFQNLFCSQWNE